MLLSLLIRWLYLQDCLCLEQFPTSPTQEFPLHTKLHVSSVRLHLAIRLSPCLLTQTLLASMGSGHPCATREYDMSMRAAEESLFKWRFYALSDSFKAIFRARTCIQSYNLFSPVMMITWWMKLGGNLPSGHDALLFLISGTGSFLCSVAQRAAEHPRKTPRKWNNPNRHRKKSKTAFF